MTEIGHELLRSNQAERFRQNIEDHQLFRVIGLVQASEGVWPEELGEDFDARAIPVVGEVDEHLFDSASELIMKDIDAFRKMSVGLDELLDADLGESELVTSSPKAVPAKFPIPVPMQIRAVVFLESNASPVRTIATAGDFRIIKHETPGFEFPEDTWMPLLVRARNKRGA